jgi:hypothetical protein
VHYHTRTYDLGFGGSVDTHVRSEEFGLQGVAIRVEGVYGCHVSIPPPRLMLAAHGRPAGTALA